MLQRFVLSALSFGALALSAPTIEVRHRAPIGYPYYFMNFKSVARDSTPSNYSGLYWSYNNNGPRGINGKNPPTAGSRSLEHEVMVRSY